MAGSRRRLDHDHFRSGRPKVMLDQDLDADSEPREDFARALSYSAANTAGIVALPLR
jgi:hypothetical protein